MPRIFLVLLTGPTGSTVTFSSRAHFSGRVSKRLFSPTMESFSCDLREMKKEKRKLVCFFPLPFNPNYLWSNYPARVYAFFSRTLWPCCGCSEVWTHYRSCLPPKHTIKTPPANPPSKIPVSHRCDHTSDWADMFTVKSSAVTNTYA